MHLIKKIFLHAVWWSGVGPIVAHVFAQKFLLVAYHSIGNSKNAKAGRKDPYRHISIFQEIFRKHLRYLRKRGYVFYRFCDVASRSKSDFAHKVACIYFDDGFRDVLENAYPILKKENIPATLFLTTDYIDQKDAPGVYLTWEEAKSMNDVFEFGSHSVSHRKLNKISSEEAKEEMARSKAIIEEKLGIRVSAFSYPKGRSSRELENLAHEVGYVVTTADSLFHKVRPDPDDSLTIFKLKTRLPWL